MTVNLILKYIPDETFKFSDNFDIETENGHKFLNDIFGIFEDRYRQVSDNFQ